MDWDGDGALDILSGSYLTVGAAAGQLQILQGSGENSFSPAQTMLDSAGQPIENVNQTQVPDNIKRRLLNLCTQQHAVDLDADGDLDLVVGSNMDQFFLRENLSAGDNRAMKGNLAAESKRLPLRLPEPARHASPHLADWDNDGDLDLLSGSAQGGVFFAENLGTPAEPVWGKFKQLLPLAENLDEPRSIADLKLGGSTRVWAHDVNGDGQLDLLVGDKQIVSQLDASANANRQEIGSVWLLVRKK